MGMLVQFLTDNYIYFVISAGVLVLALIGYIIDNARTEKLKKEYSKDITENSDIPIMNLDTNLKISDNVNNMTMKSNDGVKDTNSNNQTDIPSLASKTDDNKQN